MVRHLRLRQVLITQGYTGKELHKAVAFEHRNWREDGESLPTIEQVRKMHETLGTWDIHVNYDNVFCNDGTVYNFLDTFHPSGNFTTISPKANYKYIKEARWKEQEKRTLEFFEREGC
ncbi:hypothetical protein PDK35_02570 [Bacillus cereus group sp. TH153LC]|uniref:hypothetical protein n=1 Tax=Bacillus cereus group sp. TH153LC TaxID=3018059 RepID=UPI0022E7036D|nr:hypothetical protein [Bacillus cereus group sp. TH153LC]MDA1658860.1 hypothetical protein [Bacillus cereus group sp. TH153LC]